MELEYVGGTFGGIREPASFMQLMLKMLQIQPEKEIIVEFIKNEDYKYVRVLGAFYMRLVGRPVEVYQYLEPLYNDYRKIRRRVPEGTFVIVRMDELIDEMLRETYLFDISMPHLPKRIALQASGQLAGARRSALEDDLDELEDDLRDLESKDNAASKAASSSKADEKAALPDENPSTGIEQINANQLPQPGRRVERDALDNRDDRERDRDHEHRVRGDRHSERGKQQHIDDQLDDGRNTRKDAPRDNRYNERHDDRQRNRRDDHRDDRRGGRHDDRRYIRYDDRRTDRYSDKRDDRGHRNRDHRYDAPERGYADRHRRSPRRSLRDSRSRSRGRRSPSSARSSYSYYSSSPSR